MGPCGASDGDGLLTTYLLDTTILIDYLRGEASVMSAVQDFVSDRHRLGTSCVNLAELERGLRGKERRHAHALTARLRFLVTDREAARRAGTYQAEWAKRGQTIHTPDALIAGTARAHGAVLVTHNVGDFPMRDIRVITP